MFSYFPKHLMQSAQYILVAEMQNPQPKPTQLRIPLRVLKFLAIV